MGTRFGSALLVSVGLGLVGGAVAFGGSPGGIGFGGLVGVLFALLVGPRATDAGGGLLWGLAFSVVLWAVGPATLAPLRAGDAVGGMTGLEERFGELVGSVLGFGLPLGLLWGIVGGRRSVPGREPFGLHRAVIVGGLGGIVGGGRSAPGWPRSGFWRRSRVWSAPSRAGSGSPSTPRSRL